MNRFLIATGLGVLMLGFGLESAQAVPIHGTLSITGSVKVDATNIDWLPPGGGDGDFNIDPFAGGTDFFASLQGTAGDILDLNLPGAPVGVPNLGIMNFMVFDAAAGLTFTLNYIAPGPFSAVDCTNPVALTGQTCTFAGSPFGLTNLGPSAGAPATGSSVDLVLFGTVSDGSSSPPSQFRGTFTTQFNTPFQPLIKTVFVDGGSVQNTYSGTFEVTAVPEPMSILLLGAGLLGLTFIRRGHRS